MRDAMRKRNPDRPVVALPMANQVNETLAFDLKYWKGACILRMYLSITISCFINWKKPRNIIDKLMIMEESLQEKK